MKVGKLWGGRFDEMPSEETIAFLSGRDVKGSAPCDERLIPYDLWGNRVHVLMLCRQGILSSQDGKKILKSLRELNALYERGEYRLDPSREDVHSNIESFLIERAGIEYGGRVHTGRSRNDQIALDMRLYLRQQVFDYVEGLIQLIDSLLRRAHEHRRTLMPGYTHHQPATPTTFGHLLLSFAEAHGRDIRRLMRWVDLFNENPLGAGAGYGTSFTLDRKLTSRLLAFGKPTENVSDSITQRWEAEAELAYGVAVMMNHLSTMAQTFILLSTREFNMIRLDDRHCSGSSVMPQKRNPDTLEVIKAKSSFAHGIVASLLSVGRSLFMGYNRETQWTKYWIMGLIDETKPALPIMADVIQGLKANPERMLKWAADDFIGTTQLMEWMTAHGGLPLRQAKMVMERAVRYSEREGKQVVSHQSLKKALNEMKLSIPVGVEEVERIQRPEGILTGVRSVGTPSLKRVEESLGSLRERMRESRAWLSRGRKEIEKAKRLALRMEKDLGV